MTFIGKTSKGNYGDAVGGIIQGADKIRLTADAAVISTGINIIGPDIAEEIDSHGRIDGDEGTVPPDDFGRVGDGAGTHLDSRAHMTQFIQFRRAHDEGGRAVSHMLLFL